MSVVKVRARVGDRATITVRESVLIHVSSVLADILADVGHDVERVVTLDADASAVRAFLLLAHAHAHDHTDDNFMTLEDTVRTAILAIPLIHKFDASGLLNSAKAAMCACARLNPSAMLRDALEALFAVEAETSASAEWMDGHLLDFVVHCARGYYDAKSWLDKMPKAVLAKALASVLQKHVPAPPSGFHAGTRRIESLPTRFVPRRYAPGPAADNLYSA